MTVPAESQERGITPETSGPEEQPMPTPGGAPIEPVARSLFNDMLTQRTERGIQTYGMPLSPFNGRDAVQDAMEEAIDLWQYLVQLGIEFDQWRHDAIVYREQARVASEQRDAADSLAHALRADVERLTAERDGLRWELRQLRGDESHE